MKTACFIILLSTLFGCYPNNEIPDLSSEINYKYRSVQYSGNPENEDIIRYQYFDNSGKLIEEIGKEYRAKFLYNNKNALQEKIICRIYNCDLGWREIFIYDDNGNYLGSKNIIKNHKYATTPKFKQIKFYKNNHPTKELWYTGTYMNGSGSWERWKYYSYNNNRVEKDTIKENNEIIWTGDYKYDNNGNLSSISRNNSGKYEIERFQYDNQKRLTKKSIKNDEILSPDVSFSVFNNTITYQYDTLGRLVREVTFNHRGERSRDFYYKYESKK